MAEKYLQNAGKPLKNRDNDHPEVIKGSCMSNAVRAPMQDYSHFSPALRARFSIVPKENNSILPVAPTPLLSEKEEALLKQTLSEIRDYAASRRQADEKAPTCFISFVHGKYDELVEKVAEYLEYAGITVYADIGNRHEKAKLDRASYMQKAILEKWDFVVVIGSHDYINLYKETKATDRLRLDKKAIKAAEIFSKKGKG
jgi:hypothetical protein